MDSLKLLWENFESKNIPSRYKLAVIGDVNLTLLESDLISGILTVIQTEGRIGTRIKNQLSSSIEKVSIISDKLEDNAKNFFLELKTVAIAAQAEIKPLH